MLAPVNEVIIIIIIIIIIIAYYLCEELITQVRSMFMLNLLNITLKLCTIAMFIIGDHGISRHVHDLNPYKV